MNAQEFLNNLAAYIAKSPENAHAEIMLRFDGDVCIEFGKADDCRGLPGQHYLVFVPNFQGVRFGVRELKKQ